MGRVERAAKTAAEEASSEAKATEVVVAMAMMEERAEGVTVERDP